MGIISVLIADDHDVVCEGLESLLSKDTSIQVVGTAHNGNEVLAKAEALRPDVVLLDVKMPGLGGIQVCRQLRTMLPQSKIIILSMYSDEVYVHDALQAGAAGYLLKNTSYRELVSAIHGSRRGERVLSPELLGPVLDRYEGMAKKLWHDARQLSTIEMEILRAVAAGATNREVGEQLHCTEVNVKKRMQEIFRKLDVNTRSEAVAKAIHLNLL